MTLLLLLSVGCLPGHPPPQDPSPPFRFVVLGDRTDEPDDGEWRRMAEIAAGRRPDLVLTVGDLADDGTNPDEWTRALAGLGALRPLVEFTPGNHDIVDAATAAMFTAQTGQAPYRSFDRGGLHFVIVDNSIADRWEDVPEAQRTWLEGDLAAHSGRPIFVFMHKPFWASTASRGQPDALHASFVRHGVRAVFTGHWHNHLHDTVDGVEYVGVGSSGGVRLGLPDPAQGNVPELVEVTVQGDEARMVTVTATGELPVDAVTVRDQARLRRLRTGGVTARLDPTGVDIHVENVGDTPLDSTVHLDGGAWRLASSEVPVHVEPGATFTARVAATPGANAFPLPRLTLAYPLPDRPPVQFSAVADWAREVAVPAGPAPTVDGVIDPEEWAGAARIDTFTTATGLPAAGDPTVAHLLRGADALYLAVRADDAEPAAMTRVHRADERDGQVVYDDRIGVMLAPAPDQLYWFYVTPNAAIWDLHADRTRHVVDWKWDAVEARSSVDGTGWTVEVRVPFAALGVTDPDTPWAFDLRRRQNRTQTEACFTPAFASSQPARIGRLTWAGTPTPPAR